MIIYTTFKYIYYLIDLILNFSPIILCAYFLYKKYTYKEIKCTINSSEIQISVLSMMWILSCFIIFCTLTFPILDLLIGKKTFTDLELINKILESVTNNRKMTCFVVSSLISWLITKFFANKTQEDQQ